MDGLKRAAVFVLLRNKDKWLMLIRKKAPFIGYYVPVGGKIDPYESPKDAALRETYEETGIKLDNISYCGTLIETSPINYNWISYIYISNIDYQQPQHCNEGELVWIDYDSLHNIPTPPTDLKIFEYARLGQKFSLEANFDEHMNMTSLIDLLEE